MLEIYLEELGCRTISWVSVLRAVAKIASLDAITKNFMSFGEAFGRNAYYSVAAYIRSLR